MALALKVPIRDTEKWKKYLSINNLFDATYRPARRGEFFYFPVKDRFIIKPKSSSTIFVNASFEKRKQNTTLKEALANKLTQKEIEFLQTSQDIIGSIAILEIPTELETREKIIAKTLLEINSNIHTVLKKAASHEGVFRTQKMQYLAGKKTKEATYKENGVTMLVDVERVYFSPRLSNERLRIARQVKTAEKILVMFSGCAPYPVVLSKNSPAKYILGIEINPVGHRYGLENLKLNNATNIGLINGDVHTVVPKLLLHNPELSFDRIIMPLPKTADEFIDDALAVSKKGTIIHFYDFLDENNFDEAVEKINTVCKKRKMKCKILRIVKVGQHAPRIFRVCVDFQIA